MAQPDEMIALGRIKRQRFTKEEVAQTLQRAHDELDAARMIAQKHNESAFELAYNAMFLAATALMQNDGYRTSAEGHHRTLVEYLETRIGPLDMGLVSELDEARKKRNGTFYDRWRVTNKELQHILAAAKQFLTFVPSIITDKE